MLNEERVKHMVKLAFYETKGGSEEIKISFRRKKDYINSNIFWSVFWMTISYIVLVFFIKGAFLNEFLQVMSKKQLTLVYGSVFGLYIVLLVTYVIREQKIYKIRHAKAYRHAKKFREDLAELEKLYEKEDINA